MPAGLEGRAARNDVVVLPLVPVTPTRSSSRLGSPYHHAAAEARAGSAPLDDELDGVDPIERPLDGDGRRAPPASAAAT